MDAAPRLRTAPDTGQVESPFWFFWRLATQSLATLLVAAVVGAALAALAWRFGSLGPGLLFGAAVLPLLALAVVSDPRTGLVVVFLTFGVSSAVATSLGSLPFQLVELAVITMVTLIALRRLSDREAPLGWHPGLWWGIAIVTWAVLALPSGANLKLGVNQVASLGAGVVFAAAVIGTLRSERDVRVVLGWFVGIAAGIALLGLTNASDLQSSFGGAVVSGRLQGAFDQPNQLGSFSAMGIPIALGFALGGRSTISRVFGWLAAGALFGALLLSLSRGAWIGMTLATLYLLFVLPAARRRLALTLIPVIFLAAGLGAFLPRSPQIAVVGQRLGAITATNPYDERTEIWKVAREQVRADPWTGQGPGSFPVTSARAASGTVTVSADHAHNIWLTWAAEMGVPAVLFLTGLMLALAFTARRSNRSAKDSGDEQGLAFGTCLTAALITLVGQGLVDYTWRNQVLFVAIATLIGASFALARARNRSGVSVPFEGQRINKDISTADGLLHS